jgi:FkbM family methyltransferase
MQRCATWEISTGALLRRLLRPGSRFLDVGAGVGYFSVLAAKAADRVQVDSVEPNPETTALLRFNLWLNDAEATVWPVALTDARRAVPLTVADNNIGDTRGISLSTEETYSLIAAGMPADDIFPGKTFDVVKIDVQGWETEVLLGMQRIMKESPSIAIVVEFWPSALRQRNLDPGAVLDGYRRMALEVVVLNGDALESRSDKTIVDLCDSAGPEGSLNLLLRRR